MEDEMDVLETVLNQADAPVHLVAHSFGAWVALALAMRRAPKLLSMTLLEPTAFNLLDLGGESALNQEVHAMTRRYFDEWDKGHQQAVRHVINFYGAAGTFDAYKVEFSFQMQSGVQLKSVVWVQPDWGIAIKASFQFQDKAGVVRLGTREMLERQRGS